ncbi:MAG: TVP38/TMEM64 family protein [Ghiorsea sp.]|nr:TVP38/TMEM64 family protein [Ghiorsea sp.]
MLKRSLPLLILAAIAALFISLGWHEYLSFEQLKEHRLTLNALVLDYPILSPLVFIVAYIVVVAFSLPGGTMMTLAGGFLFGVIWGGFYTVLGATIGATIIFLIAKTSLGDALLTKAGKSIQSMKAGFQEDAMSYMFVLRLVPLFPFFIVNLVPAFLGVPLRTYIIATFFGIMPATFVFSLAGSGLGKVFEQGGDFSIAGILTAEMIGALVGLGLLSLVPVFYKKFKGKGSAA